MQSGRGASLLLWLALSIMLGWLVYDVFFGKEAREYFRSAPWSLLLVALIATAGGLLSWAAQSLKWTVRRRILIAGRGVVALSFLCLFGVFVHQSAGLLPEFTALGFAALALLNLYTAVKRVE